MYSMKRKIVVDSSSNLSRLPGADFACVPLKIITAEREYVDDESTDAFTMAQELRTYKGKSSTSCPNVGDFLAAYGDVIYDILYGEQYIADKVNRTGD